MQVSGINTTTSVCVCGGGGGGGGNCLFRENPGGIYTTVFFVRIQAALRYLYYTIYTIS